MLKKIMIGLMSLVMAMGIFLVTAQAEELQEGDYKYQILEDGTAEITGYTGSDTEIVIPGTFDRYNVTRISEFAFDGCNSLSSVKIPESVTDIGYYAFSYCNNLSSVDLSGGVTNMGSGVFEGCINLSKVVLPEGLTKLETDTFRYCRSLSSILLPDGVKSIGIYVFYGCNNLSSIEVAENNTEYSSVDGVLFDKTKSVLIAYPPGKGIVYTIPDGVISIGDFSFLRCSSLKSVIIPEGVTTIGVAAFQDCSGLTDVYYRGSETDWNTIQIGEVNDSLTSATIHYNFKNTEVSNVFEDISSADWFYEAVSYVYEKGIMTGMNDTSFAPLDPLTRAQFAVILHRIEGEEDVVSSKKFDDVEDNSWYTKAVLWAYENGIVSGYENTNKFGTHDNISREQLAVMMYRYAKSSGFDVETDIDLSAFKDAENVSSYAVEAMKWAVGNGIITGKEKGTRLDPNGNALRAECATIIQRYIENQEI